MTFDTHTFLNIDSLTWHTSQSYISQHLNILQPLSNIHPIPPPHKSSQHNFHGQPYTPPIPLSHQSISNMDIHLPPIRWDFDTPHPLSTFQMLEFEERDVRELLGGQVEE